MLLEICLFPPLLLSDLASCILENDSAIIYNVVSLYVMCVFLWLLQGYLLVLFSLVLLWCPSYGFLYIYPALGFLSFLDIYIYIFFFKPNLWILAIFSFNIVFFYFWKSSSVEFRPLYIVLQWDALHFFSSLLLFLKIGYFLLLCFRIIGFFLCFFNFPLSNLLLSSLRRIFPF